MSVHIDEFFSLEWKNILNKSTIYLYIPFKLPIFGLENLKNVRFSVESFLKMYVLRTF